MNTILPKSNMTEVDIKLQYITPLAEQKRFVAKLEELLPLCDMLKRG